MPNRPAIISVELRGLEPQRLPAKTTPEMQLLARHCPVPLGAYLPVPYLIAARTLPSREVSIWGTAQYNVKAAHTTTKIKQILDQVASGK
jgi:hypothetical protein